VTDERASVYRLHDAKGALLYVGYSVSPKERVRFHRYSQTWGHEVDKDGTTVQWFPTMAAAADAEVDAIRSEFPKFNKRVQRAPAATPERRRRQILRSRGYPYCTETGCKEVTLRDERRCPEHVETTKAAPPREG